MKLKDSVGKEFETALKDVRRITAEDKKLIELFVKDSGCGFKDFSGFKALDNCIIISAVRKDDDLEGKLCKEYELRLYKNQVDGMFCGFEAVEIYHDGSRATTNSNEFICMSVAEQERFPQMHRLTQNARQFFHLDHCDCKTYLDNSWEILHAVSKPDPEYAEHCAEVLRQYTKAKAEGNTVSFMEYGKECSISVRQHSGNPFIEYDGAIYRNIDDLVDDLFRERDEIEK